MSENPPRNGEGDRSAKPSGGGGPRPLQAPIKTVKRARRLRREMTLPAVLLWKQLKLRPGGFKFRREHPEDIFVADFCCLGARLLIEVDGEVHNMGNQPEFDAQRDGKLAARGYRTLRIPARYVLEDMAGAINAIVAACREAGPLHHRAARGGPPPRAGEDL